MLSSRALFRVLLFTTAMFCWGQRITGELRQWHRVTLTFDGPASSETATPNPFLDHRLSVEFHKGAIVRTVPGFFAADGNAAESGATGGNQWRVYFVPPETGTWSYRASFRAGPAIAVSADSQAGRAIPPDGVTGQFEVAASNKTGRDHRAKGMLEYVGEHYARYAGSGEYFIQVGTQSPENFLAYSGFDNTVDRGGAKVNLKDGLHHYEPHVRDWKPGDPVWRGDRGKGIIGALNYLASKGMNTYYSLLMNNEGDGREINPWIAPEEDSTPPYLRYDVSKLDQWEIVFSHGDQLGMQFVAITQEEENEQLLGKMTVARKLYYRELIARFAHHHAWLWDLDEEMDRWRYFTTADIREMCTYIKGLDPYKHPIQYVQWKGELIPEEKGYGRLLGFPLFDGTALQHDPENTYDETLKWVKKSAQAGHKWLVSLIEINPTSSGVVPDADDYWHDAVRKQSIWGNLMAGGSGTIFFFGTRYAHTDLDCEDWRSRDHFWDLQRYAHTFFVENLPFHEMTARNELTPAERDFVFAKPGAVYAIYLPEGGSAELDLGGTQGQFEVLWYNPRTGGAMRTGSVRTVAGGGRRSLGQAPSEPLSDWAVLVRPQDASQVSSAQRPASSNFHVKLGTPIDGSKSRAGDLVTAVMISPERLLGGRLEGRVVEASATRVRLQFDKLLYRGATTSISAEVTGFVNSKGHPKLDDNAKPAQVEGGVLTGEGPVYFDEGAELRMRVQER